MSFKGGMEISGPCVICKTKTSALLRFATAKDMMNSLEILDELEKKMYCKKCKAHFYFLMESIEDEL